MAGVAGSEPELLAGDAQVPAGRHDPIDLDGVEATSRFPLDNTTRLGHGRVLSLVVDAGLVVDGGELGWCPDRQRVRVRAGWAMEPVSGERHVQRLMGPGRVVFAAPPVDRRLGGGQILERALVLEHLALDRLMPPFDLPG